MTDLLQKIKNVYKESFVAEPKLFFSPGRINLIGEHIDYNDGFVMPAAIDKGIYYAVDKNNSNGFHFYAADFNEWFSADITSVKKTGSWKNYVLSVINEFLLADKKIGGFNCVFGGNVPRGSGMSSSAAVEGGLAFALNEIFSCGFTKPELALLCQRAEHNFPGVKCGIMDQFANMMGKKDNVLLLDCKTMQHQYFPLQLNGYKIILLNSKVHHSLASGEYNARRKQCEEGLQFLGKNSFRNIDEAEVYAAKEKMSEDVFKRCLYVVQEIKRTRQAADILQKNNLAAFGKLMFETHEGLSKLYGVSCKELDWLVDIAKQHPAIIGSRLMGGGFGGCTINIVKENMADDFIATATEQYKATFKISPEAYTVQTADGTAAIASPPSSLGFS